MKLIAKCLYGLAAVFDQAAEIVPEAGAPAVTEPESEVSESASEPVNEPATEAPIVTEEPSKTISFDEVRGSAAAKSEKGFSIGVKGLITKYGAEKISAIDPSRYKDFLAELEALK